MKKLLIRSFLVVLTVLGAAAAVMTVYVMRTWDRVYDVPLVELHASADPAVIRRGQYLVFGPAHCVDCHVASRDLKTQHPLADGETISLTGGMDFPLGPLGTVYSRNLTPDPETGIGRYSDGQIARMMRYAVRPDGKASISPMMPFDNLSDEDVVAVISFLRSQQPVRHVVPANQWTLLGKVLKSFVPTALPRRVVNPPATSPAQAATRERGEYLARYAGNCVGCHTPRNQTTYLPTGPDFAGGQDVGSEPVAGADPSIRFRIPNLTPAPGSALSKFPDRETFIARFQRGGRQHAGSPMPWECFSRLSTADLGALYEFLHSLPPAQGPIGDAAYRKAN
jgi:mono/diheme cytochrome c family protein